MPQPVKNAPDQHDVYNMVAAIAENFNCRVEFTKRYYADYVQVIARCYLISHGEDDKVLHQSLSKRKYAHCADEHLACYTLAFDLWCQLDGGGATAADRGPAYGWNGRVEKPRRRT